MCSCQFWINSSITRCLSTIWKFSKFIACWVNHIWEKTYISSNILTWPAQFLRPLFTSAIISKYNSLIKTLSDFINLIQYLIKRGACVAQRWCNGLPCDVPGFNSRSERCIYRASRPSQGTVNGGAVSKWPRCRWDVKHNQPTNVNYTNISRYIQWKST